MKIRTLPLLFSLAALGATNSAFALTTADTTISNTATISYDVGGTGQADIGSSEAGNTSGAGTATTFEVDRIVDLSVTAGSGVDVTPGTSTTTHTITYDLANDGNDEEVFNITFGQGTDGTDDDFDTTGACLVTAATSSTSFTDTTITIPQETTAAVTVTCSIPAVSVLIAAFPAPDMINDKTTDIEFIAKANRSQDNGSADVANDVETVYADEASGNAGDVTNLGAGAGIKNGIHSAVNTYTINTAVLSVQKTSTVVCDPYNGTTNPKRIPGAIIKYDILVTNGTGAAEALNVAIADPFPANMTYITAAPTDPTMAACNAAAISSASLPAIAGATVNTTGSVTGGSTTGGVFTAAAITISGTPTDVNTSKMSMAPSPTVSSTATLTFYGTVD